MGSSWFVLWMLVGWLIYYDCGVFVYFLLFLVWWILRVCLVLDCDFILGYVLGGLT